MRHARLTAVDDDERADAAGTLVELPHRKRGQRRSPRLLALLVTDLEGFTPLVERLGDEAARRMMRLHDRLVRAPIERHQGREVAHTGDGVMAAFESVRSALSAAGEIQRALVLHCQRHRVALRARIGVHAGEPLPTGGRLIGHCVNTAVRVCAAADSGQVLVTELVASLAAGAAFRFDAGLALRLKGLSTPVMVRALQWRDDDHLGDGDHDPADRHSGWFAVSTPDFRSA